MQLIFETTNTYVVEIGKLQTYTNLKYGNEPIKITCTKINCAESGNLVATINSVPARQLGQCTDDLNIKCKTQTFEYELRVDEAKAYFEVQCKYAESGQGAVTFTLYRLCNFLTKS